MKHIIDLQMFSGEDGSDEEQVNEGQTDPGEGVSGEEQTGSGTDGSRSEFSDEKKYTDEDLNRIIERKRGEWLKRQKQQEAENSGGKKYTDEDVDKIIEQKHAEWEKRQREKQEADESMNDDPEIKELRDELDSLRRKAAQSEMMKTARSILADKNISVNDDLVSMIVSEDEEQTTENAKTFADMFKGEVNKAVKNALKGETPRVGSSPHITKEQIMAVKNTAERQKLIKENMHLF